LSIVVVSFLSLLPRPVIVDPVAKYLVV